MESIGSYLKRQREMRAISLGEVAQTTKIHIKSLAALEADDFSKLPGFVFAKGFVYSYAKAIGLDAEEAMLQCEDYLRTVLKQDPEKKQKIHWLSPSKWHIKPWFLVLLITVGIVVITYWTTK